MTRAIIAALVGTVLCVPVAFASSSGFNGTWKEVLSSAKMGGQPYTIRVAGGMFSCASCVPQTRVKADGAPHDVRGDPEFDALAVTVLNDHTIRMDAFKGDKTVSTITFSVARNGRTATYASSDLRTETSGRLGFRRVGHRIKDANLVSGSWLPTKVADLSDNARTITYNVGDKMIAMTTPAGQSYIAPINGKRVAFKGDPRITMVAVRLKGNSLWEGDYRDNRLVKVSTSTLLPGGKTMIVKWTAPQLHHYGSFEMTKQ
ncbi:MAG: hypothetical protein KGO02_23355 [Alphaproteobacteria bacterium]|nr:hypothetical protein [Alphaproteobacteria bacterium]